MCARFLPPLTPTLLFHCVPFFLAREQNLKLVCLLRLMSSYCLPHRVTVNFGFVAKLTLGAFTVCAFVVQRTLTSQRANSSAFAPSLP